MLVCTLEHRVWKFLPDALFGTTQERLREQAWLAEQTRALAAETRADLEAAADKLLDGW